MASIDLTSGTAGAYGAGELQLQGKVQMTSTLTPVTDNLNVASPLLLSTTLVQTTSTLKITTNDNPYIDAEDGAGNNRFTVGRATASQQVNVDFASNPVGSTTAVGAIRTFRDGTNLSEAMTFREDGNVGIGTTTPTELLDVSKNQASPTRINISNTDAAGTSTLRFTNATGAAAALFENSTNQFTFQNNVNSGVIRFQTTNAGGTTLTAATITGDQDVGIGTTAPVGRLHLYKAAAATRLAIDGDAGQNRLISYRTGALQRFGLYVNNTAESGANAGSNFAIRAYNDAGTLLSTPLFIERSTGNVGVGTTTPATVLDVVGSDFMIFANNSAGNRVIKIGTQPGVGEPAIQATLSNGTARQLSLNPSGGNVGIGTTTPTDPLVVSSIHRDYTSAEFSTFLQSTTAQTVGRGGSIGLGGETGGGIVSFGAIIGVKENSVFAETGGYLGLMSRANGGPITEKARITSDGYLRMLSGTGGIQFNGDTAAANALDDYEEGTWTPGFTLDSGSVSAFTSSGSYTKIGRQVSVIMTITFTTTLLATINEITGLPFTAQNLPQNAIGAVRESANTGFMWQWRVNANATQGLLRKYDNTQSISNGDTFIGTLTYFV